MWLTLKVAAIAVPLNTFFGLAAAWCVAHFRFRGRVLYNEYQYVPAFAVASVLALLAILTLAIKSLISWMASRALREAAP